MPLILFEILKPAVLLGGQSCIDPEAESFEINKIVKTTANELERIVQLELS